VLDGLCGFAVGELVFAGWRWWDAIRAAVAALMN